MMIPVRPGDTRVLADARSMRDENIDLYLGVDLDNDGVADPEEVRCTAVTSTLVERCEFPLQAGDQTWWAMVHTRGPAQAVLVEAWAYNSENTASGGDIAATGPGHLAEGESFPVRVSWNTAGQPTGRAMYAMLQVGNNGGTPALVPIRIERPVVLATPHALGAEPFQVAVAPGGRQDRLYVDVPWFANRLTVRVNGQVSRVKLTARLTSMPPTLHILPAPPTGTKQYTWSPGPAGSSYQISSPGFGRWYIIIDNPEIYDQVVSVSAEVEYADVAEVQRGSWYNPDRSGHGLILHPAGPDWAGLWYTYLQDGTPTWYYLQGPAPSGDRIWRGSIYRATWNGSANYLTPVGQALVTPNGTSMTFSYRLDGESASERMERLGYGCPMLGGSPLDVSSHWFDPEHAGTGYSVQMWDDYEFYAAFVYDGRGVPRFLTAEIDGFAGADAVLKLEQLRGFCPLCAYPAAPQRFDVGNLRRRFAGGSFAGIEIDAIWTDGVPGAWSSSDAVIPLGGPESMQGCE
jgi:hypothetical protein